EATAPSYVERAPIQEAAQPVRSVQGRRRIGKRTDLGIADARLPDRIDVEHPPVPETRERRVHLARENRELLVAGRFHVGPRVRPLREEGPVFEQADALVDQSRIVQEVCQALRMRAREPEHQSATDGKTYPGGACATARAG